MVPALTLLWRCCERFTVFAVLQYALGAAAALLFIYAAIAVFRPTVNRVLLLDFSCFNIPQRCVI